MGGDVLSPGSGESPSVSTADPWLLCPPLTEVPQWDIGPATF